MPCGLAGLDRGIHLRDLAFADQVADRGRADHDLVRRDAAAAGALQQRLRDHRAQRFRQHRAHHVLLCGREHVDDAVDGLGRRARVQGAEHQVAGLGGGQRQADRLQVAHFTDQHDVGILAQRRAQRFGEAERVAVHLALVDQAALGLVHELDRILDGDDVIGAVVVAVVDHAGQRRGLARAGRSGDQHQAARQHAQVAEDLRRLQVIERQDDRGNVAEHRAGAAVLVEGVDAEARQLGDLERKVGLEELLVRLALLVVHDVVDHAVHFLVRQRGHVDALHVAIDADHRRHAGGQMQVGRIVLDSECQELRDIDSHRVLPRRQRPARAGRIAAASLVCQCSRSIAEGFHGQYVNGSAEFAGALGASRARSHRSGRRAAAGRTCRLRHTPGREQGRNRRA